MWPNVYVFLRVRVFFSSRVLLSVPVVSVGPISTPREGAVLARSPLYPLLPGALVRLMVTKGARAFAEALLADG